ncbi:hypothetical protein EVAR_75628_1 [Eumeta japonica]|uniref:Uncharacterized protein n=1 Tax=Eumeta variegata TaxID=151549 RepID=A0A4C1U1E9_EUMVA|nr:hypothetical protein EVAR_75628_1 [Eumeta japonica]
MASADWWITPGTAGMRPRDLFTTSRVFYPMRKDELLSLRLSFSTISLSRSAVIAVSSIEDENCLRTDPAQLGALHCQILLADKLTPKGGEMPLIFASKFKLARITPARPREPKRSRP